MRDHFYPVSAKGGIIEWFMPCSTVIFLAIKAANGQHIRKLPEIADARMSSCLDFSWGSIK